MTRLVIEIVRRGSAQNLVIVRSGLTLTNRLSPRLALEIGMAYATPPPPPQCISAAALQSTVYSVNSTPTHSVVRSGVRVAFGETCALPIALAARCSESRSAEERLCFRPIYIEDKSAPHPPILFDWSQQLCHDRRRSADGEMRPATSLEEIMDWKHLTKPG